MADRSKQSLAVYDKSGAKVATGGVGTKQVELKGLEGGKQVAKGDYQLAYTDGTNTSDKVDVPAFTVLTATVSVTGVTVDPATTSIKVGKTTKLTANVAPDNATNKAVNYKSSNEAVATVAPDGTVKAVAAGTADITATTADGGFNAKCAVTVTKPEAAVTPSNNNLALGTDIPFTMTGTGAENEIKRMYSTSKPIAKGTTVTIAFDVESTKAEGDYMVQFVGGSWQVISSAPLTTGTQHQSYTVTADADYSDGIQMRMDKSTSAVTVSNFVISESSK